jgi:hypothetical protein
MSMIADDLTEVPALAAGFPSTITLPMPVLTISHILQGKTSFGQHDHCSHRMTAYGQEMSPKRKMNYAKRSAPVFTKIS